MSCRLSVIVPTHDRPGPLARVVDCLTAQTRLPDEIVIVNDAADEIDPRTGQKIRAAGVEFQYWRPKVASAAASRNRGMAMATGDILFLVDDDMSLGEDCLMRLLDLYRTDTRGTVAGIGPMWADPPPQHLFRRRLWNLLGRFMRRTSIDELPQLFNVLAGRMSIVGPRPLWLPEALQAKGKAILRTYVKPGLTCLWQISGRSELSYERWVELDIYYIENRTLLLDALIIIKTIPAVLSGKGAY